MPTIHYRIEDLEQRKLDEIEHSRNRRKILRGYERVSDTNASEQIDLGQVVRDPEAFKKHFSNVKYYSIQKRLEDYERNWFRERCRPGIRVLDYACGSGENGIMAAGFGATVVGIDISPEGVENAEENAKGAGVGHLCSYEVMDGENLKFDDNSFDYIVVYGALHHVDLDRAMEQCRRVLKPNGEMLALEALRHNPFIHAYRKLTPHLRTPWEVKHILGVPEIRRCGQYFELTDTKYFHLLSLFAVPFRKTPIFVPMRSALDRVDELLLQWEAIGKYAWVSATTFSHPKKS
ncbi:MAG TPA: class I SAM-dependent methyltransferase [Gemmatimonadaceae bacterium]|jgi:ubiquinone/menaquinone biosynthesis C-methylase UbiE|nr:class I SAM-dependent methyltransferase [Gemmatimonadaceae bacterium]